MRTSTAAFGVLVAVVLPLGAGCSGGDGDDGETSVFAVKVGQCFQAPTEVQAQISDLERVDCREEHDHEAYARVRYRAPDGTESDDYPGDEALTAFADGTCASAFGKYVGVDYLDSSLFFTYLLPSPRSWQEDDRSVLCLVTTTGSPLQGSVKGSKL